jgi:hypothetical protein
MLATETRPCSECKNFRSMLDGFSICNKKLMGVTTNMLVTYKVEEGSCFELKGIGTNE